MIAFVEGTLREIGENQVILENHGIGYQIFTPVHEELLRKGIGSTLCLYTYLNVREDALTLYGFLQPEVLTLFRQLINVNGVGPRFALAILTVLSAETVILAIAQGDHKTLSKVSGIGPKTAQRIILDLKDKVSVSMVAESSDPVGSSSASPITESGVTAQAILALESLGYAQADAAAAVRQVMRPEASVQDLIKESLTLLSAGY